MSHLNWEYNLTYIHTYIHVDHYYAKWNYAQTSVCVCVCTTLYSLESHHLLEVSPAKVGELVSLPGECQHSIWSQPNCSVHARGEVNTKEWKSGIWNLITTKQYMIEYSDIIM